MDMENEISKKEVVDLIADFFKQEVLPELSSAQKHKLKTENAKTNTINIESIIFITLLN